MIRNHSALDIPALDLLVLITRLTEPYMRSRLTWFVQVRMNDSSTPWIHPSLFDPTKSCLINMHQHMHTASSHSRYFNCILRF